MKTFFDIIDPIVYFVIWWPVVLVAALIAFQLVAMLCAGLWELISRWRNTP